METGTPMERRNVSRSPSLTKVFVSSGRQARKTVSERPIYSHKVCDAKKSGLEAVYNWAPKSSKGKGELLVF